MNKPLRIIIWIILGFWIILTIIRFEVSYSTIFDLEKKVNNLQKQVDELKKKIRTD